MRSRHACFITCVLTVLAGLAACNKEPAAPVHTTAAAPAWPEGDTLRVTLPLRAGQTVPLEQRIHRDEAIEWIRRDRDGRTERWLQNADGTLRHRDGDGNETPPAPPPLAAMSGDRTRLRVGDLLATLSGIRAAHAAPANTRDGERSTANGRANSGSIGATNANGRASANTNSGGANSGAGGGSNSNANGGGANSGTGGGSNSNANGGGANSGTGSGSNSNANGGGANSGAGGGSNSSSNGGGANSGAGGGSNSNANGGGANSGAGGGSNSNANSGGANSGTGGGSNSNANGDGANSGAGGGSNSNANSGGANSGTGGGSNSNANGGGANSGEGGGSNSNANGDGANSGTGGGSNSNENGDGANSGEGGGSNSNSNGDGANSGAGGGSNSNANGGGANSGTGGGSNSNANGGGANSGVGGGSNSNANSGGANSGAGGGSNSNANGGGANSGTGGGSNSNANGDGANSGTGGGSNSNANGGGANAGAGGAPVPPAAGGGSGMGDPHYVSADGVLVSTQKAGEFWAMDSERGLRLQTRQEPWHDSQQVAGISAIAAGVGARRVGIHVLPQAHILLDGRPLDSGGATFRQVDLDDGGAVGVWSRNGVPSEAAVVWPDGSHVFAHLRDGWIDFRYRIAGDADVSGQRGLLGSADGNADNDRTARDGTVARTDDALDAFIESWRIRADESLFDYADGSSTDSYQRLDFPQAAAAPDAAMLQAAAARCRDAGVMDAALREACAFDLAVTGDDALLASHHAAQLQMQSRPPATTRPEGAHPASGLAPDMAHAQTISDEAWQRVTLDAGQSRTFAVDLAQNAKLVAHPEDMSCVDAWDGAGAGWQWFDAQGRARSTARMACADLDGDDVDAGRYYIVVVAARDGGPGSFSFRPYIVR